MIKSALYYLKKGISVIPTGETKSPHKTIKSWTKYQTELMSVEEVERLFAGAKGIATIGGMVSGGRVHIDFDTKYDLTGTLYEDFCQCINEIDNTLMEKMVIIKTPSGGYHWVYNTDAPTIPSMKLANRETTIEEREVNPNEKIKVLIETKGDKGYCLAPPTNGYEFVSTIKFPVHISKESEELILETAKMFNTVIETKVKEPKRIENYSDDDYVESPFDAFNKRGSVNEVLLSHGWTIAFERGEKTFYKRPGDTKAKTSGNFNSEKNLFSVFTTSSEFESQKGYTPVAVYCLLNHNNDWSKCAKDLLERGYGKNRRVIKAKYANEINKLKSKDYDKEDIVKHIKEFGNISDDEASDIVDNYENNLGKPVLSFWEVEIGKDDKKKIHIMLNKFVKFINEQLHVYRYSVGQSETSSDSIYHYVKIENNVIEEVSMTYIKDQIIDYIKSLDNVFDGVYRDALMEVIQQKSKTMFSDEQMEFLDYTDVEVLRDTFDTAYYPFKNTIVYVDKFGINTMDYSQLNDKVIWKNRIIQHEFNIDIDYTEFSFNRFINKIMGDDLSRIEYFASCIGYLLHSYKDELKPICIIFGEEVADSKEGGGAGKGIVTQALSKMLQQVVIDGKGFKADKPFAFQRVKLGTQLIILQDTDSHFDFESLFSKITDGLTVERKNVEENFLSYSESPKFLITTNYTIPNTSSASRRRQRLIEFSNFFNDKYTPFDYLGEYLFYGWKKDDWNKFYTMMLEYVCFYLQNGLLRYDESESSIKKRIITGYGQEFMDFFADLNMDYDYELNTMYTAFLNENGFNDKNYSKIRFSKAIDEAIMAYKYKSKKYKNTARKTMISWGLTEQSIKIEQEKEVLPF